MSKENVVNTKKYDFILYELKTKLKTFVETFFFFEDVETIYLTNSFDII